MDGNTAFSLWFNFSLSVALAFIVFSAILMAERKIGILNKIIWFFISFVVIFGPAYLIYCKIFKLDLCEITDINFDILMSIIGPLGISFACFGITKYLGRLFPEKI